MKRPEATELIGETTKNLVARMQGRMLMLPYSRTEIIESATVAMGRLLEDNTALVFGANIYNSNFRVELMSKSDSIETWTDNGFFIVAKPTNEAQALALPQGFHSRPAATVSPYNSRREYRFRSEEERVRACGLINKYRQQMEPLMESVKGDIPGKLAAMGMCDMELTNMLFQTT